MNTERHHRFRIGQLGQLADVNPQTIRYYESVGLLPEPNRTANGYRAYSEEDVARLAFIRRAQRLGLTLDAIRDILNVHDAGDLPCSCVRERAIVRRTEIERHIEDLRRVCAQLTRLAERADACAVHPPYQPASICPAVAPLA